ncbi:MAG: exodeoxyribonuclease VII small subunit [Treponema sp.]|nr:exodeoxyribonuclease VII small subunit [Treponema sp.]
MNTFETNLRRLEELTAAIKQQDISLEDALKDFEEGITLAKKMEKELNTIEGKIQILMNGEEAAPAKQKAKETAPVLDLFTPNTEVTGTRIS